MAITAPIPVVLVGQLPTIAQGVADALKPAYEIIHTSTSINDASTEFPRLLRTEPISPTNNMGTHNFAAAPKAALIGRSFCGQSDVQQMRDACRATGKEISFILQGPPSLGTVFGPGYAETIAKNLRDLLDEMRDGGTLGKDGVFEY